MTTAIIVPNSNYTNGIKLYDIPSAALCRVFAVLGGSLDASLANLSGRGRGESFGDIAVESQGIRTYGNGQYISYSDIGTLSPSKVVQMVAFKSPVSAVQSGLVNIWSASSKNSDSSRRRIFLNPSSAQQRLSGFSEPSTGADNLNLDNDAWYIASQEIASSSPRVYRLHAADGSVIAQAQSISISGSLNWAEDVAFEIGNSTTPSIPGGSLIACAGLWSGTGMTYSAIVEAAAYMAQVSGLTN